MGVNGKQIEQDVRNNILFGDYERLTYELAGVAKFVVEMETEDGENYHLAVKYNGAFKTLASENIPWHVAFLDGVIEEVAERVYEKGDEEETLPYLGW